MDIFDRAVEPGQVHGGMRVLDAKGHRLGTVARVHAPIGADRLRADPVAGTVIELRTGFLGRGEPLYVPLAAVTGVAPRALLLGETRREIEERHPGWRTRPADLPPGGKLRDRGWGATRADDWFPRAG